MVTTGIVTAQLSLLRNPNLRALRFHRAQLTLLAANLTATTGTVTAQPPLRQTLNLRALRYHPAQPSLLAATRTVTTGIAMVQRTPRRQAIRRRLPQSQSPVLHHKLFGITAWLDFSFLWLLSFYKVGGEDDQGFETRYSVQQFISF